MNSTKRAIKYQNYDSRKSIIVFWIVILIVDFFAYLFTIYSNTNTRIGISTGFGPESKLSLMGMNIMPILIYLITYNYTMYYESFPITINFSITRKDFFKSLLADSILISFIFAVIQSLLWKVDPIIVKKIGLTPLYDFIMFNTKIDSLIFIIFSLFISFLAFGALWNLIASLNYKFGAKMWLFLLGLSMLVSFSQKYNLLNLIFPGNWLNRKMDIYQILILGIFILIFYSLSYIITIRTDVKNKVG